MGDEPDWLEFFEDRERRYAKFYLDYAQQHAQRDPEAYARLEAEIGNLLKSATWLAYHDEGEGILALATALWQESDFLRSRGYMQRGLPLLERAREAAQVRGDVEAEFRWLEAMAHIYLLNGDLYLSQSLYEQALGLAQSCEQLLLKAAVQFGLGRLQMDLGQLDRAVSLLKEALWNFRELEDNENEIEALTTLANTLSLQGKFDEATEYLEQGLLAVQSQQSRRCEAEIRYALGYNAALAEDWSQALNHFEVATEIGRETGDLFREVRGLHNMGEAWLELGDVSKAVALLEEAVVRQEAIDDIITKAFTHFYLAKAYKARHDLTECLEQLEQVYPFRQVPISITMAVEAEWLKAEIYLEQGNFDLAQSILANILQLAPEHMGEMRNQAHTLLENLQHHPDAVASFATGYSY